MAVCRRWRDRVKNIDIAEGPCLHFENGVLRTMPEKTVTVDAAKLLEAYEYGNMAPGYDSAGYVSVKTGETYIYISSDLVGEEDADNPPDLQTSDEYLALPSKNELGLGRNLALAFAAEFMADEWETVRNYFSRSGAYRRFRSLLIHKDKLDAWYAFEERRTSEALHDWCAAHGLAVSGGQKGAADSP
jgi:hypothetical protein